MLKAVIESLPGRYISYIDPPPTFAGDCAHLTRFAIELDGSTHQITGFIADRACDGWTIDDGTVRTILFPESGYMCAPNLQAASDFLYALQRRSVPVANLINIVAGVSLAILDFDRNVGRSPAKPTIFVAYITLMQRNLSGVGTYADTANMTISVSGSSTSSAIGRQMPSCRPARQKASAVQRCSPVTSPATSGPRSEAAKPSATSQLTRSSTPASEPRSEAGTSAATAAPGTSDGRLLWVGRQLA